MKREKTVVAYACDCCGAEIDDKARLHTTRKPLNGSGTRAMRTKTGRRTND